nr:DUF2716 domain-containing protein [Streptomyces cupreus]
MDILSVWQHTRPVDLVWLEKAHGTDFSSIGGITGPRPELLHAAAAWAAREVWSQPKSRYVVAEASGELVGVHRSAGFHEVAEVTTYRWAPPGEPARERPARLLFSEPEHDEIWRRFEKRFEVTYETACDGIAEPPGSVTWHMEAVEDWRDPVLRRVEAVVARGLRACRRGGRATPTSPTRTSSRSPLTCAWARTAVEEDLTELLGRVLRRDGRPVGNVWTFGPVP